MTKVDKSEELFVHVVAVTPPFKWVQTLTATDVFINVSWSRKLSLNSKPLIQFSNEDQRPTCPTVQENYPVYYQLF